MQFFLHVCQTLRGFEGVKQQSGISFGNFMSMLRFCFHVSRIAASFFTMQRFVFALGEHSVYRK